MTRFPKVSLSIREMETAAIIVALLDDEIDAGIAATPIDAPSLRTQALFYEPFSVYLSAGHRLLDKTRLRDGMLETDQLWLLENGHCLRDQAVRACSVGKGSSAYPNVEFEAGSLATLRHIIRTGRGYTLVPELFVQTLPVAERTAHIRPMARPVPTREMSILYRRNHLKSDIRKTLAESIQSRLPDGVFRTKRAALNVLSAVPS